MAVNRKPIASQSNQWRAYNTEFFDCTGEDCTSGLEISELYVLSSDTEEVSRVVASSGVEAMGKKDIPILIAFE